MYTAVGFKIIYVYIQMRHTARDGCVLLIDDVNDEFTNSPREDFNGQQRVQVHGHGAGKSSSNPLPVDRCPHANSNFPSLVFLKKHDCVYTSSFFVCL